MVKMIRDRRYKGGYRTEYEASDYINCLLLITVILTYGIALIPIGIYYYYKGKNTREQKDTILNQVIQYIQSRPEIHYNDLYRFNITKEWIKDHWDVISREVPEAVLKHNKIVNDGALTKSSSKKRSRYISKEVKEMVKRRDNYQCVRCGKKQAWNVQLHVDHIVPFAKGGSNDPSNLQTLCASCNLIKSDDENFEGMNRGAGIFPESEVSAPSKMPETLEMSGTSKFSQIEQGNRQELPTDIVCPTCAHRNQQGNNFCEACGSPLTSQQTANVSTHSQPYNVPTPSYGTSQQNAYREIPSSQSAIPAKVNYVLFAFLPLGIIFFLLILSIILGENSPLTDAIATIGAALLLVSICYYPALGYKYVQYKKSTK